MRQLDAGQSDRLVRRIGQALLCAMSINAGLDMMPAIV
jgi:hypothetical protein